MTTNKCSTSSCPYFLSIFIVAPQRWRSLFTPKMAKLPFTPNDYSATVSIKLRTSFLLCTRYCVRRVVDDHVSSRSYFPTPSLSVLLLSLRLFLTYSYKTYTHILCLFVLLSVFRWYLRPYGIVWAADKNMKINLS